MKKILIPSIFASFLLAQEAYIEVGGGYSSEKDSFSTGQKENISKLGSAKSESGAGLDFSFFYSYDLSENMNIYTQYDGGLTLGSNFETNYGNFDISVMSGLSSSEEWENPFLINTKRKETKVKETGLFLTYSIAFSNRLESSFNYGFTKKDYDKETVLNVLKRQGNKHTLSIENSYMLNEQVVLSNGFLYEKYNADGKASSYDKYGLSLGFSTELSEDINLSLETSYAKKEYEAINPIFNRKVDANIYGINTEIKWDKPLNYKNTYVSFKAGYENEDSNVKFYDKNNSFSGISIGYRF